MLFFYIFLSRPSLILKLYERGLHGTATSLKTRKGMQKMPGDKWMNRRYFE